MDWVRLRTHVVDHVRFLEAGPHARDLWAWGMLYAGEHETDGHIPMTAVLAAPWGYGGRANVKAAQKLVEVGLWERTDGGFLVLRWAEQGNPTKATIQADREAARARMRRSRGGIPAAAPVDATPPESNPQSQVRGDVRPNFARSSPDVPTSTSTSDLKISRSDLPDRSPTPSVTADRPAFFDQAADTVEATTGTKVDRPAAWLRYSGHRTRDGKAMSQPDAVYWLTTVDVREARRDREDRRRHEDRERARAGPPPVVRETPEQARAFAAALRSAMPKKATAP